MGLFEKLKNGLKKTRDGFAANVRSLVNSFTRIDEDLFDELEEILIMADIGTVTTEKILDGLRRKIKEDGLKEPSAIIDALKEIMCEMMTGDNELICDTSPTVILVIGVNGVGKTTSIGKLANYYISQGKKVVLGAADTFRAAAIDQIEIWAQRVNADLVKQSEGADPAAVVFDTCRAAVARNADIAICDTAGRLHNKKNLMDELSKINKVVAHEAEGKRREVLLVLDATTGRNAVNQAREFSNVTDITGIILTKLDGTAKGGVVLAIEDELKIPVKFVGVGEKADDLMPFDPKAFVEGIFEE